jgi:hypothetical protein
MADDSLNNDLRPAFGVFAWLIMAVSAAGLAAVALVTAGIQGLALFVLGAVGVTVWWYATQAPRSRRATDRKAPWEKPGEDFEFRPTEHEKDIGHGQTLGASGAPTGNPATDVPATAADVPVETPTAATVASEPGVTPGVPSGAAPDEAARGIGVEAPGPGDRTP